MAEYFGGLIGYNGANGAYKHIYVFADMMINGMSTTIGGLIAENAHTSSSTLQIQFCVLNLNFAGDISDDANIAGIVGRSSGNLEIIDC